MYFSHRGVPVVVHALFFVEHGTIFQVRVSSANL